MELFSSFQHIFSLRESKIEEGSLSANNSLDFQKFHKQNLLLLTSSSISLNMKTYFNILLI